jgi:hypothetical protein
VLGYGWTHNWALRVLGAADPGGEAGYTIVVAPDGARLRYVAEISGTENYLHALPGGARRARAPGQHPELYLRPHRHGPDDLDL